MNQNAETLKEFLVELGFKVDSNSFAQFKKGTKGAELAALGVAGAAVAAAAAVVLFTTRMSAGLNDLYWASQRTQSSVGSIQGFQFAVSQLGGSAEGARSSLEGLAQALRTNPGLIGFVNRLGIKTQGRGAVDIMGDLGTRLKQVPYFVAYRWAQMLGIDEKTLLALESGQLVQQQRKYNEMLLESGLNADTAASLGKDYNNSMIELNARLEILGETILVKVAPRLIELTKLIQGIVGNVSQWKLPNSPGEAWSNVQTNAGHAGTAGLDILRSTFDSIDPKGASSRQGRLSQFMQILMASGFSKAQAAGMAGGGPMSEDWNFDPNQRGSGGEDAFGLGQWHKPRRAMFKSIFGYDMMDPKVDWHKKFIDEAKFFAWEAKHPKEAKLNRGVGALSLARDAGEAAILTRRLFEGAQDQSDFAMNRAANFGRQALTINQHTEIKVSGAGSPSAVGAAVAKHQDAVNVRLGKAVTK